MVVTLEFTHEGWVGASAPGTPGGNMERQYGPFGGVEEVAGFAGIRSGPG